MKNIFNLGLMLVALSMLVLGGLNVSAYAQGGVSAAGEFTLQGRLTTAIGTAVTDGQHILVVNIYPKGGTAPIFSETDTVATADGIFATLVGSKPATKVRLDSKIQYEIGLVVDGQAELLPHIVMGETPQALTARSADTASIAINANAVGGYKLDTLAIGVPRSIVTLNSAGRISGGILDSSAVTSINGSKGAVTITSGGSLSVTTSHDASGTVLSLAFAGSGGGLNLPNIQTIGVSSGTGLGITNTLNGTAAEFVNSGIGNAVHMVATVGSALSASSNAPITGPATIESQNTVGTAVSALTTGGTAMSATSGTGTALSAKVTTSGTAISATGTHWNAINATAIGDSSAVMQINSTSGAATATLLAAVNNTGSRVLTVAANGATQIQSSAATALEVSSSATSGVAAKLTGGLTLVGSSGTATIPAGVNTATIANAYAKATSIVFVTLTTAAGIAIPLTVTGVANGSFTIAPVGGAVLVNAMTFNYLIINPS